MAAQTPKIVAAAAAAVLSTKSLTDKEREPYGEQRYYVHPHVAAVGDAEPALTSYLDDIYGEASRVPIEVPAPSAEGFKALKKKGAVAEATREVAEQLRVAMEPKRANPGIVFGFLLEHGDGAKSYGIIKADLENERRFYMEVGAGAEWSIGSVRDILPPPQTKYAKYAIVPRPKASGAAGIRDVQADADAAAGYFLAALGVVVPRREGTKVAVAQAAKQAGYEDRYIRRELGALDEDVDVDTVLDDSFPDVSDRKRKALQGSPERPMRTVVAEESFLTTWFTRNPVFRLTVDESVEVTFAGRTVTVTLPEGHDPIDRRYER